MGQWRANGMPADDTALEDLGLVDQSVLCHCHGVPFRFTSETFDRDAGSVQTHGTVLTLRQLEPRSEHDAIDLVEIADGRRYPAAPCESLRGVFAATTEACDRIGRRYASRRLFETAERLLTDRDIA